MEKENQQMTPNNFIKTTSLIHLALLAGIILFGIVIYFQNDNWVLNYAETENAFFYIVPIISIVGIFVGNTIFKIQLKNLALKSSLNEKLIGFQAASIIKYALIEGPALLGIVSAMLSGNLFYLLISGLLVIYFYSLKPTKHKIAQYLNLNSEMQNEFNKVD